jgi:hypothetical protein
MINLITENIAVIAWIGVFMFIFDAIFLGIIFSTGRKVAQASRWPSAMGTILMSMVQWRASGSNSTSGANYPVVMYSYQAMGQAYQGNKIAPGPEVGGMGAQKVVARYPMGTQVMVYYNPENPSEALLERGTPGIVKVLWISLVVADAFLCGLGAVLVLAM